MRKREDVRGDDVVAVEEEIEVQGSRRVTILGPLPAQRTLDPLQERLRLQRVQRAVHLDHPVGVLWIVRPVERGSSIEGRDSPDAELGVHDRHFVIVGTHLAGTCRVMNGDPGRADMRIEVRVGIAIPLRRELPADEPSKRPLPSDVGHYSDAGPERVAILLG